MTESNQPIQHIPDPRRARIVLKIFILVFSARAIYSFCGSLFDGVAKHAYFSAGIVAAFAVVCHYSAIRAWFFPTTQSIRWLCNLAGVYALGFLLVAVNGISRHLPKSWMQVDAQSLHGHEPMKDILQVLAVLFTLLCYRLAFDWFSTRLDLREDRRPERRLRSAKLTIGVSSLLIWMAASRVCDYLAAPQRNHHAGSDALDMAAGLGPILLAALVYKVSVLIASRLIQKSPPRSMVTVQQAHFLR
jgi:hypothetical protein